MGYIIIDKIKNNNKKIMIFVEGTILKPKSKCIFSKSNITRYVAIGNAVEKIKRWQEQGFEIIYLTSLKSRGAMKLARRLDELGFVGSMVGYRQKYQNYNTLFKEEQPDFFIEDDCKSIGKENMIFNELDENIKSSIKHIVVDEFSGIDEVNLYE